MTEEQKKECAKFAEIAKRKNFHPNVCIVAGVLILGSDNWHKTLDKVMELAEKYDCDEFSSKLLELEENEKYKVDDDFMKKVSD